MIQSYSDFLGRQYNLDFLFSTEPSNIPGFGAEPQVGIAEAIDFFNQSAVA
jgi:hypothetical protein